MIRLSFAHMGSLTGKALISFSFADFKKKEGSIASGCSVGGLYGKDWGDCCLQNPVLSQEARVSFELHKD